jgi:hypothetical protein
LGEGFYETNRWFDEDGCHANILELRRYSGVRLHTLEAWLLSKGGQKRARHIQPPSIAQFACLARESGKSIAEWLESVPSRHFRTRGHRQIGVTERSSPGSHPVCSVNGLRGWLDGR